MHNQISLKENIWYCHAIPNGDIQLLHQKDKGWQRTKTEKRAWLLNKDN